MAFKVNTRDTYTPSFSDARPGFFALDHLGGKTLDSCPLKQQIEYYTIILIADGSGTIEVDFKSHEIKKHALVFLTPGQVFRSKNFHVNEGFQISFDKHFYCPETHGKSIACDGVLFNNVHRVAIIDLEKKEKESFYWHMESIFSEMKTPGIAHREMIVTQLRMLLIQALRKTDLNPNDQAVAKNRLVRDFIALVNKHYLTKHSVSDYAEMLAVSPKSLSKRMKAEGYASPSKIIRERLMLEAQRRLRLEEITVKSLAYDLGFEDPAYFNRIFSKEIGQSPLAYQKAFMRISYCRI